MTIMLDPPPDAEDAEEEPSAGRSMAALVAGRVGLVAGSGEAYSEGRDRPARRAFCVDWGHFRVLRLRVSRAWHGR